MQCRFTETQNFEIQFKTPGVELRFPNDKVWVFYTLPISVLQNYSQLKHPKPHQIRQHYLATI